MSLFLCDCAEGCECSVWEFCGGGRTGVVGVNMTECPSGTRESKAAVMRQVCRSQGWELSAAWSVPDLLSRQPLSITGLELWSLTMAAICQPFSVAATHSRHWWGVRSQASSLHWNHLSTVGKSVVAAFQGNNGGWYPKMHCNRVRLVVKCFSEFWAYSAHGKKHSGYQHSKCVKIIPPPCSPSWLASLIASNNQANNFLQKAAPYLKCKLRSSITYKVL